MSKIVFNSRTYPKIVKLSLLTIFPGFHFPTVVSYSGQMPPWVSPMLRYSYTLDELFPRSRFFCIAKGPNFWNSFFTSVSGFDTNHLWTFYVSPFSIWNLRMPTSLIIWFRKSKQSKLGAVFSMPVEPTRSFLSNQSPHHQQILKNLVPTSDWSL